MAYIMRKERKILMADVTRNERTNVVTEIMEHETVTTNRIEDKAAMYIIMEQYRTCNYNGKNYGITAMAYIMALKRKWEAVQT